jgi:phospholipid-binding lipoprotein MlaA
MNSLFKSILALAFIGFTSLSQAESKAILNDDPYESFNRAMFDFNIVFSDKIGQPIGNAYRDYVPQPAQTGLNNFLINLKMPLNMTNNLLQGKVERGLGDFMRFSINTVFGLGGLIDIATPAGLPYQKEDFGQTLQHWGVWQESNFIVMPILGGYTTRELTGGLVDTAADPTYRYIIQTNLEGELTVYVVDKFNAYVKVIDLIDTMNQAPDPYIFYRESYIQYRTNLLYDGKPPMPSLDDFDFN